MDRGPTVRFWGSNGFFLFQLSCEFWPIHWYEVMIRSRRNEKARRRIKIERRSDNFRYWTKGLVREKKRTREEEDKFLKEKKKGRRRTQRNRICAQLKQQPADCQHSHRSHLRCLLLLLLLLLFSFFSFFFPLMEITL